MNQVVVADGDGGEGQGAVGVEVSLGYHRVGGVVGRNLEREKHVHLSALPMRFCREGSRGE